MKTTRDAGTVIETSDEQRGTLKRRGLIAGAAALAVGLMAKQTAQPVGATTTDTQFVATGGSGVAFLTTGTTYSNGLNVFGSNIGVVGNSTNGAGVSGGSTAGNGVDGSSSSSAGVQGTCTSGTGVRGISTSGAGVFGSSGGLGVLGFSTGSYGVLGQSTKPGFAGLTGITTTASVPAFAGGSGVAGALAAQFTGGVYIDCTTAAGGQFVVNPMSAKFGTIQHHDGSLRLMASMEAPESWAVDFGEGQLSGGHASVQFEADFAAVIEAHGYRVFLTPEGETKGLYVTNKTASGFEVHEVQGGTSSVGFTWQVAAHPRAQKSERLKKYVAPVPLKVELPKIAGLPTNL